MIQIQEVNLENILSYLADNLVRHIENVHLGRFALSSEVDREALEGIPYLEVGHSEDFAFLIIFEGHKEDKENMRLAEAIYREPELLEFGNVVISNSYTMVHNF